MQKHIRIGSRGSKLALWQANFASDQLRKLGISSEIIVIKTQGDRVQDLSFQKLEGKGFFTKELEEALLGGEIDLAVHSHKDLPTENPAGLLIAAVSYREDPVDTLLVNERLYDPLRNFGLPKGAVVGTSSARRKGQLLENCPDIVIRDIRGNVPTRIAKLQAGDFDAILLAQAGLNRLGLEPEGLKVIPFRVDRFIPAPAQGVLAYQCREEDDNTRAILEKMHDAEVQEAIQQERTLLSKIGGGCQLPLGAYCRKNQSGKWEYFAALSSPDLQSHRQVFLRGSESGQLAERALKCLQRPGPASVFISRDLKEDNTFRRSLARHGIAVRAESLIRFEPEAFEIPADADWLFFSSRTGVREFTKAIEAQRTAMVEGVKVAAIGSGTSKELLKSGITTDYVANPFDLENSLADFIEKARGKRVVFPSAANSLRSVQKKAGQHFQSIDVTVYRNSPRLDVDFPIEEEVVVLTSPLNAKVFIQGGGPKPQQRIVAIGPTTAKALQQLGVENVHTSRRPGEFALLEAIWSLE